MIEKFVNDETGYLQWIDNNPNGYILNLDEPLVTAKYPMIHLARHKVVSSSTRTNYTTGRYFKVCSTDMDELANWAIANCGRPFTWCEVCKIR
jgi:hypothetical protein